MYKIEEVLTFLDSNRSKCEKLHLKEKKGREIEPGNHVKVIEYFAKINNKIFRIVFNDYSEFAYCERLELHTGFEGYVVTEGILIYSVNFQNPINSFQIIIDELTNYYH
jgi:hypothetical protein